MRRDPILVALVLVGFGAGYCRGWLATLFPDYTRWNWQRQLVLRLLVIALSAACASAFIAWRLSWSGRHADPGAYWTMWSVGLVAGVIADEVHGYLDTMFL